MGAEPSPRLPGSFRALGERLVRDAFGPEAVEGYLRRAESRVRRVAARRPPPAIPDPSGRYEPVVLLVDDEEDLRDIMRRMLERRGFRTLVAADAGQALQLCRDHPAAIDLVVTDLSLPGMSGREFAAAAAAAQPNLRVVFISGLPREIAVRHHLIAGDDTLVKKPFSAEALIAALHAVSGSPTRRTP
jgi:CheY-like chemotaxis protein